MPFRYRNRVVIVLLVALLGACGSVPPTSSTRTTGVGTPPIEYFSLDNRRQSQGMVIFALGLLDTGYRFGGRNPELRLRGTCETLRALAAARHVGPAIMARHRALEIVAHTDSSETMLE